jgi:hypothetical protein
MIIKVPSEKEKPTKNGTGCIAYELPEDIQRSVKKLIT